MKTVKNRSEFIILRGIRVHNLKNIDIRIPLHKITIITGVSGSGKSSLAFDTLYAEGQRRYVESMSAYVRQFLERLDKPDADEIQGICPAIAVRQKKSSGNPRSTVGTVTEIFDFLRLLYARIGITICRQCGHRVEQDQPERICKQILQLPAGTRLYVLFPLLALVGVEGSPDRPESRESQPQKVKSQGPKLTQSLAARLRREGFARLFISRQLVDLSETTNLHERFIDQDDYVLVDRLVVKKDLRRRLVDSLETCLREGDGHASILILADPADVLLRNRVQQLWPFCKLDDDSGYLLKFSEHFECQYCGISYARPEPRLFSFNNPHGACPNCQGFGNTASLDLNLVIPNPSKTLGEGAIDPWTKPAYQKYQKQLQEFARDRGIPMNQPFNSLESGAKELIIEGGQDFPGIKGFFEYLERKKYKMHVRIFLSRYRGYSVCQACEGQRLRQEARDIFVAGRRITEIACMSIRQAHTFFRKLRLNREEEEIADKLLGEIMYRLDLLMKVGLAYLGLDRLSSTLSGGETQRIQLSTALGSSLVGALYVLDEPSIGLHPRDGLRLIQILKNLRDIGNTVLVVEHDPQIVLSGDFSIDLGPGAGELGGRVVHHGSLDSLKDCKRSLTSRYLFGDLAIPIPLYRRPLKGEYLEIEDVTAHNLKNLTLRIPLKMMVCLTGVSGSGKSTLAHDVVYTGLRRHHGEWCEPVDGARQIRGVDNISGVALVDQSPIGRSPRSNPVTYIKAFDEIRSLFAGTRVAMSRNLGPGHFSFNIPGGRCDRCQGSGVETVTMQFLADVELTCEECRGTRYKPSVLDVRYRGKNIHQVLSMTVVEALEFFAGTPRLVRKLKILEEVGLGYLRLGQSSTTLSGGEAQRIKMCSYLGDKRTEGTLYIFDEPTTGLHFDDIAKLLRAFDRLLNAGASLLVIEHNLDIIKNADWVIDLGPEGGEEGGYLVAEGTPEEICRAKNSYTGRFLRKHMTREAVSTPRIARRIRRTTNGHR